MKLNAPRVAAYEAATRALLDQAAALDPATLDLTHPEGWSPRQVIHHLADSEAQSYARLRRLVAEPLGSIIQGYDEGLWAAHPALGYERDPIDTSLAVFAAVRAGSLAVLQHLEDEDLARYGETRAGGLRCVGQNMRGQLGDRTTMNRTTPVDVMGITDAARVTGGSDFTCVTRAMGGVLDRIGEGEHALVQRRLLRR